MPSRLLSDAVPPTGAGLPDYWSTMGGIGVRLEMFGEQLEWGTFNNAVKITASSIGVFNFMIVGPGPSDPKTCDWCAEHWGQVYRQGQFMPQLPKHPWCRHWFDIEYLGEKK